MKRRKIKRQENKSAAKHLAAAERRSCISMALGFGLFALLATSVLMGVRTFSPAAMVQAQVVHGGKIDSSTPSPNSNISINMLTVLSNSIAATATMRAKLVALDSNSLPEVIKYDGKNYLNLTFVRLSSFPFKVTPEMVDATQNSKLASYLTEEQVPDTVKAFTDKSAAITGFMLPVRVVGGMTSEFLLLRNQSACCYGIMPRVNEWVIVETKNKGVKPVMDVPVMAFGKFHVGDVREDGRLVGIYELQCDQLLTTK